jgi:phosphoglycerol transferase MdoB-like AlkP superfamily enzyme
VRKVQAMGQDAFLETAKALGMERLGEPFVDSTDSTAGTAGGMNVVLILQESTRNKHLSLFGSELETQPLVSQYTDRMELFPRFFATYAASIHARFAAFTGLYPVKDFQAFTRNQIAVKSLFEVLDDEGYSSSMFYSSFFDYTSFRDFLRNRGIDEMYDADTMPGADEAERLSWGVREEQTLAAMQERIRRYATETNKFFLTYIPAAPHYPYDGTPKRFRKHASEEIGDYSPFFLNELLYMDWIIASILDELEASGLLDNTLVVITSDHGEMLGGEDDNGAIGHGWAVNPELANVPLIVMNPRKPGHRVNDAIGSHVDLLPTILDILDIPAPSGELYQGVSLYSEETGRLVYLNSYQQYGVISNNLFYAGSREAEKRNDPSALGTAFILANDGARPLFVETNSTGRPNVTVNEFDRFQESLLRHYSKYQEMRNTHQSARR